MWVIRLGLIGLLVALVIAGNNDRLCHTVTERTSDTTWHRRTMTIKEYAKSINTPGRLVLAGLIILLVLSWLTLLWW